MKDENDHYTIRRILVALDASRHSWAALDAAVNLAVILEAKIEGLFVEDDNLIRLASLPFACETRFPSFTSSRVDRSRMERALKAQAEQARQALSGACEEKHVHWSFQVRRGVVTQEVLAAAREADVIILGKTGRHLVREGRIGSTARAVTAQAPCCVLILQRDLAIASPVTVVYDGSPVAQRALRVASRLAQRTNNYLSFIVVAETKKQEYQLQARTADWLRQQGLLIHYRRMEDRSAQALLQMIYKERSGLLVVSDTLFSQSALQVVLDKITCPVLLVHEAPTPE